MDNDGEVCLLHVISGENKSEGRNIVIWRLAMPKSWGTWSVAVDTKPAERRNGISDSLRRAWAGDFGPELRQIPQTANGSVGSAVVSLGEMDKRLHR